MLDRSMAERGIGQEHHAPTLPSPRERGRVREGGICAAMARCRTQASASPRLSPGAPSPTSPASPTCATRSRFRERPATGGVDPARPGLAPKPVSGLVPRSWRSESDENGSTAGMLATILPRISATLHKEESNDADRSSKHYIEARRKAVAGHCDEPSRDKGREAAEDRHGDGEAQ